MKRETLFCIWMLGLLILKNVNSSKRNEENGPLPIAWVLWSSWVPMMTVTNVIHEAN